MANIELNSGKRLGDAERPYFVAEMNSSHSGNIETAKSMIDAAVSVGCDAVKFQSWSAESLYSETYYRQNPVARRMVGRFALNEDGLRTLSGYCREKGIDFSSTPYSDREVDLLADLDASYIKVASMDLNNIPFLRYVGQKGMPVVLSTGMGTLDEIRAAVRTLEETGNRRICILHCVSEYPAEASAVNLNNMKMLKREFPEYPVGYSDHTIGSAAACAATAMGAAMIEKHFTLDNSRIGWDNQMATEPEEMARLVRDCLTVHDSLGSYERIVSEKEMEQRVKMRRSLVAKDRLEKGHVITRGDLTAKRPGEGISPDRSDSIIGRRTKWAIERDVLIREEDLLGIGKT